MRHHLFFPLIVACTVGLSVAQESAHPSGVTIDREKLPESYIVQVTEYRLKGAANPQLTAAEIVALLTSPKVDQENELVETIRLSTLSGAESIAQFERQVSVTAGTVSSRGATSRQLQRLQIGTLVRVMAKASSGKVRIEIAFETSRLADDQEQDGTPPDIVTSQITTTQLVEIGKPVLIGSTSAGQTSYTVLTVTR